MTALHQADALQQQPEPVAVVGGDWTLLWVGSAPIAHIVERHPGLKVGSLLYTAPDPDVVGGVKEGGNGKA